MSLNGMSWLHQAQERSRSSVAKINYDITNLKSDDDTGDESAPRKIIPEWARDYKLKAALIHQDYQVSDLHNLFGKPQTPNLALLFTLHRPLFVKRISSAIWDSLVIKYNTEYLTTFFKSTTIKENTKRCSQGKGLHMNQHFPTGSCNTRCS